MEQFNALLALFGLNIATAGTAIGLAVLLRFARGMVPKIGSATTYLAAIGLGLVGAWIEAAQGQPPQMLAKTALGLTCVVLIGQKVVEGAAQFVPFIPKDNEWIKKP